MSRVRAAYLVVAWLFVVAILVQVFLAGLALFHVSENWDVHVGFGHSIPGLLSLLMLLLAWRGRLPRQTFRLTAVLFALVLLQTEVFAVIRSSAPVIAALHPVNAMLIFALGVALAVRARAPVEDPGPSRP